MTREEAIKVPEEMSLWKYCEPEAEAAKFAIAALRYDGPKYVLLSTHPADAQTIDTGVPFTNADHIRSMSDEELTHFKYGGGNPYCKEEEPTDCRRSKWVNGLSPCEQCYLKWLKRPAEEDT